MVETKQLDIKAIGEILLNESNMEFGKCSLSFKIQHGKITHCEKQNVESIDLDKI